MATPLPPPPITDKPGSFAWLDWYNKLRTYLVQSGALPWSLIDFAGSNITDLQQRSHANLQTATGFVPGSQQYHLSSAQYTNLTTEQADANQVAVTLGNTNNEIGGLTIGATYNQTEVQNLRDKCEELADDVRNLSVLVHALRTALITAGIIKGSA